MTTTIEEIEKHWSDSFWFSPRWFSPRGKGDTGTTGYIRKLVVDKKTGKGTLELIPEGLDMVYDFTIKRFCAEFTRRA